MNVIYSFQVFDIVFVLTGGGPRNATSVLVTYAYDTGFVTRDQGYAAAIGMVLLLLTLAFTARAVAHQPHPGPGRMSAATRRRGRTGRRTSRRGVGGLLARLVVARWSSCCSRSTGWSSSRCPAGPSCSAATLRLWPRELTLENFRRVLDVLPGAHLVRQLGGHRADHARSSPSS